LIAIKKIVKIKKFHFYHTMKWSVFLKNQLYQGLFSTIPYTGEILDVFIEDRIKNSYEDLYKQEWFPPSWVTGNNK
jgi:hypothetical protein